MLHLGFYSGDSKVIRSIDRSRANISHESQNCPQISNSDLPGSGRRTRRLEALPSLSKKLEDRKRLSPPSHNLACGQSDKERLQATSTDFPGLLVSERLKKGYKNTARSAAKSEETMKKIEISVFEHFSLEPRKRRTSENR